MAERRMFSKQVVDSDRFLGMPLSAQALYFAFGMAADDDGLVGNPVVTMRKAGARQEDFDSLLANGLIIQFSSGIVAIRHWRQNNYIQKDRYRPTVYVDEFAMLDVRSNGEYALRGEDGGVLPARPACIQDVSDLDAQDSEDKASAVQGSEGNGPPFRRPTLEEVEAYVAEHSLSVNPQRFVDYYDSVGWTVGKNGRPMQDWRAAVRSWHGRELEKGRVSDEETGRYADVV